MKNILKFVWYYTKKIGILIGIQLVMVLLSFVLAAIQNKPILIIAGILLIAGNGALYFFIGKGAALNDFKYKRINFAKYNGKTPISESCKEMTLKKAIAIPGLLFFVNLVLTVLGSAANAAWARVIVGLEFLGILLLGTGSGIMTTINGVAEVVGNAEEGIEAVAAVAGKPGLFAAFFLPFIFAICACYFVGYYISMKRRNQLHNEIKQEIDMFDRMKESR